MPKDKQESEFMTVKELAEMLGITVMTVYRWLKAGKLPHYNFGKTKRFRRAEVEAFLKSRKRE